MSFYDITYANRVIELLPPDKRYAVYVAWMQILAKPYQWVVDLWFHQYKTGTTASLWSSLLTYNKYDRVRYNTSVYESLKNSNTDNPLNTASWFLVQANFIGVSERLLYNGQTLVFTYAINKWFGTTFRQPPNQSDIYISNIAQTPQNFFRSGLSESASSSSGQTFSTQNIFKSIVYGSSPNFTINIPMAVYNALDPSMVNNENIVRAFTNKYIPAGLVYTITTY